MAFAAGGKGGSGRRCGGVSDVAKAVAEHAGAAVRAGVDPVSAATLAVVELRFDRAVGRRDLRETMNWLLPRSGFVYELDERGQVQSASCYAIVFEVMNRWMASLAWS